MHYLLGIAIILFALGNSKVEAALGTAVAAVLTGLIYFYAIALIVAYFGH